MDDKTLKALEFNKILESIAKHCASEPARIEVRKLYPLSTIAEVNEKLNEVEEASKIMYDYAANLSFAIDDISVALDKANILSILSMGELLRVAIMLKVARTLRVNILKVPDDTLTLIKSQANRIYTDKSLEEDIDVAIVSDNEMSDNASSELRTIRQRIKRTGEAIKAKLYNYVTSSQYSKFIQDSIVTIRGDRYVIPVKAECKNAIAGLIHDQSSSGQTVYIEPLAIVEMNNTLKMQILDEEREIERILREFTFRISSGVDALKESFNIIKSLDVIFAKAKYAQLTQSKKPIMNEKGIINIARGRHPLLDKDKVIPTDIYLGDKFDLLFITGPNTGGKTVSLKLVGLFEIMAMSGLYIPCYEAELSMFQNVFSDIGDEQSIEQNLSTFSSHIANIVRITDNLNDKCLVLLDELGAGTDPTEGASLAVSISSYIKESHAKAVITTHYNELKEYAVVTERVENASMDFDPITYNPTYKLIVGTPGASNAILISKKLGLKQEIIEKAQEGIQNGKVEFENVLTSLEIARRQALINEENTRKLLSEAEEINKNANKERDRLFLQREKLNENVKKETKRLVEEAMEEANEIIASLKSVLDEPTEQNLFKARTLRKSLTQFIVDEDNEFQGFGEEADGEIRVGDLVLVKPLKVEGTVVSINGIKNTANVKLGKLNSSFKLEDLLKLKSSASVSSYDIPKTTQHALRNEAFSPEINLIGQTTMEAARSLEEYIDKAIMAQVNEIRVIHGQGTGKLRESVQKLLKKHSAIASFRDGDYNEGGRGVTIAIIAR